MNCDIIIKYILEGGVGLSQALKYLIYGLISGITEIVPASTRGHQSILMFLFGMSERDPMLDFMTHLGILACIIFSCRTQLQYLSGKGRGTQTSASLNHFDKRLLFSASFITLIGLFFYNMGAKFEIRPLSIAVFFLINAIVLMILDHIRQSNKQAAQMGPFDSFLIGFSGFISVFPGLSRLGTGCAFGIIRGADRELVFNWLLLLTVPVMAFLIITDIIGLFTIGLPGITLWLVLGYVLSAAAAFCGSYIGIMLMRFMMVNSGFSVFSFYSFGASLFTFIVYLMAF